jgi:hypothetical protein
VFCRRESGYPKKPDLTTTREEETWASRQPDPDSCRSDPDVGVTAEVSGVDLDTVGIILMVVGIAGGLISIMFWSSWGGFGSRDTTIVRDRDHLVEL